MPASLLNGFTPSRLHASCDVTRRSVSSHVFFFLNVEHNGQRRKEPRLMSVGNDKRHREGYVHTRVKSEAIIIVGVMDNAE